MEDENGEGRTDPPPVTEEERSDDGGPSIEVVQELIDAVDQIAAISDFRNAFKKQFYNLARRLKLLSPMFEEFKESKEPISEETLKSLVSLKEALVKAKDLLRFGSEGSKICLVKSLPLTFAPFFLSNSFCMLVFW